MKLRPVILAAVVAFAVVGCGGSGDGSAEPASSDESAPMTVPEPKLEGPEVALTVSRPNRNELETTASSVMFFGDAEPGSTVTFDDGDGDEITSINTPTGGRWRKRVGVDLGKTTVEVAAAIGGREPSKTRVVTIVRRRTEAQKARDRAARVADSAREARAEQRAEARGRAEHRATARDATPDGDPDLKYESGVSDYGSTTCKDWVYDMSEEQRFAAAADMATSAGSGDLPSDHRVIEFASNIGEACRVKAAYSQSLASIGATLVTIDRSLVK